MAYGVKSWLAVVIVGSAATLGLARAWSASVAGLLPGTTGRDSLSLVHDSLVREAGLTATAVQRIRWSRALGDGADSTLVLGDSLLVPGDPLPVPDRARRMVVAARSRLGPDSPVPVAVAFTSRRWQRPWDGTRYTSFLESRGIDYLLPEGGPCQVVIFVPGGPNTGAVLDEILHPDRVLGPCAFVARYGPPSPTVRAWLQGGGGRIAGAVVPSTAVALTAAASAAGSAAGSATGASTGVPPAPVASTPTSAGKVDAHARLTGLEQACLNGSTGACAAAVSPRGTPFTLADDRAVPPDLVLYDLDPAAGYAFDGLGAHLLADIEAEIGADRFAAVWRTDEPVETALSDALGRPLGEWVADWATARFPAPTRSAGVGILDTVLSLLAIALLAAIGLRTGARGRPVTGL